MDTGVLHIVFASLITAILGIGGWVFKSFLARFIAIEVKLSEHIVEDAKTQSRLEAKSEEVFARIDKLETNLTNKVDRLIETVLGMKRND